MTPPAERWANRRPETTAEATEALRLALIEFRMAVAEALGIVRLLDCLARRVFHVKQGGRPGR